MILRRYHIRAGAKTTAGGTVRVSSNFRKLNGIPLAREGDPVDCPACGAEGVIKCVTPRLTERFQGKEYALGDDLCICRCNPPPKLIAEQQSVCQTLVVASEEPAVPSFEQGIGRAEVNTVNGTNTTPVQTKGTHHTDMRSLRFLERETGKPHANRPYRLQFADGKVVQGTTDANGFTKPLTQDEHSMLRSWKSGRQ